jgi:hypothetical protein
VASVPADASTEKEPEHAIDDRTPLEKQEQADTEDLYSIKNFSV